MEIRESYETRRREEEYRAALEKSVHYFSGNSYITELRKMGYDLAKLQVEYETEESGKQIICSAAAETKTFFDTKATEKFSAKNSLFKCEDVNIYGDIRQIYSLENNGKKTVYGLTESDGIQNYITIPYVSGEDGKVYEDISSHRIWKREFSAKTSDLDCALRFRSHRISGQYKIKEADFSPEDIFWHAYEAIFDIETKGKNKGNSVFIRHLLGI